MGKIISVSSRSHPGVTSVFTHLSKTIGSTHYFAEDIDVVPECEIALFGAWTNKYNTLLPTVKGKRAIVWTSSTWQQESTPNMVEVELFEQILNLVNTGKIDYLFIGDKDLAEVHKSERILYFPYPLAFTEYPIKNIHNNSFGLFTVEHFRKNRLNQVNAIKLARKSEPTISLITNCYNSPDVTYTGWLDKEKYETTLSQIEFGLSVMPIESFCYSFAELMMRGIPTICSKRIGDNFNIPHSFFLKLAVCDTDSSVEISQRITYLSSLLPIQREELSKECREFMCDFSEERKKEVEQFFLNLPS